MKRPKVDNLANGIWKSAERLRGKFKAYECQNVILPIVVIRRLECVAGQRRVADADLARVRRGQATSERPG